MNRYAILYIDDEPDLLEIGKIFLEQVGVFSVDTITSGPAAIDLLAKKNYDAIVSDYQMPVMNGIELLKKVRALGNTTPFILFTGRGREEVVIQALNEGADFYLQKGGDPVSQFAELGHKIRQAVQRKQAEMSIRDHERREADLIDFLPDATFAIDARGTVIAWNRAIEEMTGVSAREMLGKGNYEYALPFYGERRPILIDLVLQPGGSDAHRHYTILREEGPLIIADTDLPCLNGKHAVLWGKAAHLYDTSGNIVGAIESIRDITERRQMESALAESECRYRNLYQYAQVGFFETTPEGRLIACNERCAAFTGSATVEEALGFDISSRDAEPKERREVTRSRLARGHIENHVVRFRVPGSGRLTWVQFSARFNRERGTFEGTISDITETRETEDALRKSRAQLRTLLDTIPDLVWLKDPQGRFLSCNRRFEGLLGATEEEIIGKTDYDFLGQDIADFVRHYDNEAVLAGHSVANEETLTFADGHTEVLETIKTPISTGEGQLVGVLGVGRDITRRKQAEDELLGDREKYRLLLDNIPDLVLVHRDGIVLYVNPAMTDRLGVTQEEVHDRPILFDIIAPEHHAKVAAAIRRRSESGRDEPYEMDLVSRNGVRRTVIVRGTRIGFDGNPATLCVLTDITEQKMFREALFKSEEKYRLLVENANEIIYSVNPDGVFTYISPKISEMLGYREDEIVGKSIEFLIHPDDLPACREFATQEFQGKTMPGGIEYRIRHKDGTWRWHTTTLAPIRDTTGTIVSCMGICRDITGRKLGEDQLRRANRNLKLLSSITRHDINNQLTILRGHCALLSRKIHEAPARDHIEKIGISAQRIATMIQFTREYEEIGANAPVWQDCRAIVGRAADHVQLGEVRVVNGISAAIEVLADPLIARVFSNIIDNAVRHCGTVSEIRFFGTFPKSGGLLIVCEDDGAGIPADEKEQIFERGYGKNTGLGLFLAREILAITGIAIAETGEPGKGARFEIRVPEGMYRCTKDDDGRRSQAR